MSRRAKLLFFLIVCVGSKIAPLQSLSEKEGIRRVQAHLLIEDPSSALREAEDLFHLFSNSYEVASTYLETLAVNGFEEKVLEVWNALIPIHPNLVEDRRLLEEIAWGVIGKAKDSTQYSVRLATLISAYLTKDVRALKILLQMMRDTNAVIRSVAVQMARDYPDASIKDEITRLLAEEPVWFVRLDVIKAVGSLRLKSLAPQLNEILASEKNTFEERYSAIEALTEIYDSIDLEELKNLAHNKWSAMRYLACVLAAHFQVNEAQETLSLLSGDSHPSVRMAALNALGLGWPKLKIEKSVMQKCLEDVYPPVAITAAWAAAFSDPILSETYFERWLKSEIADERRLAAAALIATGGRSTPLAKRILSETNDPYVKANLAWGLIGKLVKKKKCADILYDFIVKEKAMWMWDNQQNSLFQVLMPSRVRHIDQIPNYPEAVDQLTRLELISILALVEDPRAQDAMKKFIESKGWGVTGVAAAMLLREGGEGDFELVRGLVQDGDKNVQLQACLVLAMLGHDESVESELQKLYYGSTYDQKLHILEALGYIGTLESRPCFMNALQEPFQILRVVSAGGLIQCLNK